MLNAREDVHIISIDNEPTMQNQAKQSLRKWHDEGRLDFCSDDALIALVKLPTASVDVVASAYTLHNFSSDYRHKSLLKATGC